MTNLGMTVGFLLRFDMGYLHAWDQSATFGSKRISIRWFSDLTLSLNFSQVQSLPSQCLQLQSNGGEQFGQAYFLAILQLAKSSLRATIRAAKHPLPRGVMVAQQILILFDKVRVLAGQPLRRTLSRMKFLFSSLALLLLAACASEPPPKPRPPQPLLTELDHGKTVHLVVGETVDLHLESNPTTGYSWSSLRLPEQKVVKQTHHAYQGPESTLLVGAGGKEHWRFMAVAEGKTGLDLLYRRAWEDPQDTDQKLTIEFVVTKAEK